MKSVSDDVEESCVTKKAECSSKSKNEKRERKREEAARVRNGKTTSWVIHVTAAIVEYEESGDRNE